MKNPLYGENGAVYVFGPQKGVKEEEKEVLDKKMQYFAKMTREFLGTDYSQAEGAGAAGGLGFAFLSYLPNVELRSGIDLVLQAIGLENQIKETKEILEQMGSQIKYAGLRRKLSAELVEKEKPLW